MKYRTVKASPEGNIPRQRIRDVVRGIHVMPGEQGTWMVRTLGVNPMKKVFPKKNQALDFAKTMGRKKDSKIVVHSVSGKARGKSANRTRARVVEMGG